IRSFFAYGPAFTGGVYVAVGDVTGDGRPDIITGAGEGGGPHVKVFDGVTGAEVRSFFAFNAGFTGGVRVAAADVDGDGTADIVCAAGPGGGPHVIVFSGATGAVIRSFFAYDINARFGVNVAAAVALHPRLLGGLYVSGTCAPLNPRSGLTEAGYRRTDRPHRGWLQKTSVAGLTEAGLFLYSRANST